MLTPGNNDPFEVRVQSPMGWVKVQVFLTLKSETAFSGYAKLMGFMVELTDCVKAGSHFSFAACPKLPFGVLRVEIEADVAEDGVITGVANAPRHKPMTIQGQIAPASIAAEK